MRKSVLTLIGVFILFFVSCEKDNEVHTDNINIPDFDFPKTVQFEQNLSSYNIFDGASSDLTPTDDYKLLELSSILFTDYAYKQRLVKLPNGTTISKQSDGSLEFPDGTILTKTFYYYNNESDLSEGKNIIETRLLIKESDIWNVATYIWNESQTDATLETDGKDIQIGWKNINGINQSTLYHIPTENECMTCHQSNSALSPIGPSILNLNRDVERDGTRINQLQHLQSLNILEVFDVNEEPHMVDYNNSSESLTNRGRAYLAMNCSHCHNPNAWDRPAEKEFDFRYDTPFGETGIPYEEEKIIKSVQNRKMPLVGTSMLDEEGINLLVEYLENL